MRDVRETAGKCVMWWGGSIIAVVGSFVYLAMAVDVLLAAYAKAGIASGIFAGVLLSAIPAIVLGMILRR